MDIKYLNIIFLFILASCGASVKSKKTEYSFNSKILQDFDSSKKGEININDILKKLKNSKKSDKIMTFGDHQISSKVWRDDSQNYIKQYSYSHKNTQFYEYLPLVSYFLPKFYENYEIVIVFNKNNHVVNIESFYDEIKIKPSVFCNKPKKSCVSNIN